MSNITLSANAGGTGIFTIASPSSNTNRTLTLPDATGTIQVSGTAISGTTGSFSGDLSFNSGYGSAAVAYGCRAWVNFNGTGTVAIRASGNVTSITDNGVGEYVVNFTTALADVNYIGVVTAGDYGSVGRSAGGNTNATRLTGSYAIRTLNASQSNPTDCDTVYVAIFR